MPKIKVKVKRFKQESAHRQMDGHTHIRMLPNVLSPMLRGQKSVFGHTEQGK